MSPHTFCSVLATIRSFLYKTIPGLAALGLLLTFTAQPASANSPVPLVNSLAPAAAAPGGPAFTLSVVGGAFVPGSVVNWNGSARPTTYVSGNHLTAAITAADIASAGTVVVTVTNAAPGGGTSNAQYFQITNPLTPTNFTTFGNNEIDAYRARSSNTLVGDFNGGGKPDLVAYANGIIYFLPNNGDGTFTEGNWVASPGPPGSTGYLATADLNGDGKPDLILVTTNGTFVALGNGNGTFHLLSTSLSDTPTSIVAGDFNGDGFLDLAYTIPGSNGSPPVSSAIQVQLGNGDGTFRAGPSTPLPTTPLPGTSFAPRLIETLAVGDFNGNSRLDLLALVSSNDCKAGLYTVLEFPGIGDGSFGIQPLVVPGTQTCGSQTASAVVADFNGDGILDVAYFTLENGGFSGPGPAVLNVALGNGDGSFRSVPFRVIEQIPANASSTTYGPVLAADLNGDGKLDLMTGNQIFYSNGDGSFTARGPAQNNGLQVVGLADFNGDGQVDLLALGQDPTNANMFDIRELLQVPAPADFSGGLTTATQTAVPGGSATYNGNVIALNGFTGNVALTASNLPSGVTASFNPTTVTGGSGSYTLTLNVGSGVALGAYNITVTGTSGSLVHSGAVTLIVNSSAGDFSSTLAPGTDAYQNVSGGQTATYNIQVSPIGGYNGDVTLTLTAISSDPNHPHPLPGTATFTPSVIHGASGTSTLTIVTTNPSPTIDTFTITITATSGALVHTGTVYLGVNNGGGLQRKHHAHFANHRGRTDRDIHR